MRIAPAETRAHLTLGIFLGVRACVCRSAGVLGRGPLAFDAAGRWSAGGQTWVAADVASITIEPDLITIHLGAIA